MSEITIPIKRLADTWRHRYEDEQVSVQARWLSQDGAWAVHESLPEDRWRGRWAVTHVATSIVLVRCRLLADAKRAAKAAAASGYGSDASAELLASSVALREIHDRHRGDWR